MNKYEKLLKCMNVDSQNLPLDNFKDAEGMVNWYMKQSDEMIDRIYEDYYGTEEEQEELVMLVLGSINFPHPQATDEYWDKVFVEKVDKILFVPKSKAEEIGEENLWDGEKGSDGYLVPCMTSEEICSDSHWYMIADDGGVVVISPQMEVVIGFKDTTSMFIAYPDTKPLMEYKEVCFSWEEYNNSNQDRPAKKNPYDAHERALKAVGLAEEIVENNQLYQNLYRCEEAYGCLKHDEELWKMTMNKVMTIIQDQVEPHRKGNEIQIQSGAGIFYIDDNGFIVDEEDYDDLRVLYAGAKRFDIAEYRLWEQNNNLTPTNEIDIIHIGYWKKDGSYDADDVNKCREQYLKEFKHIHDKRKVA